MKIFLKATPRRVEPLHRPVIAAILSLLVLGALTLGTARAGEVINAQDGVAMDGYDVVSYFQGGPKQGSANHAITHKGKTWHFATAENAKKFTADPARYEPQFNGFCAYGMSQGYAADVDFANAWSILDGKLYLNWSTGVRRTFLAQKTTLLPRAEDHWPKVNKGLQDGSASVTWK